jgi:hypothetical protein
MGTAQRAPLALEAKTNQARVIACSLAAEGKPVSRRTLRHAGIKGSNEAEPGAVQSVTGANITGVRNPYAVLAVRLSPAELSPTA